VEEQAHDTMPMNTAAEGVVYLTVQQAADLLQVPRSWVYGKTRTGTFPGMRRIGRYVRISKVDLLRWVEAQRETPLAGNASQPATMTGRWGQRRGAKRGQAVG